MGWETWEVGSTPATTPAVGTQAQQGKDGQHERRGLADTLGGDAVSAQTGAVAA